jgi:hypothetical protein
MYRGIRLEEGRRVGWFRGERVVFGVGSTGLTALFFESYLRVWASAVA